MKNPEYPRHHYYICVNKYNYWFVFPTVFAIKKRSFLNKVNIILSSQKCLCYVILEIKAMMQ